MKSGVCITRVEDIPTYTQQYVVCKAINGKLFYTADFDTREKAESYTEKYEEAVVVVRL